MHAADWAFIALVAAGIAALVATTHAKHPGSVSIMANTPAPGTTVGGGGGGGSSTHGGLPPPGVTTGQVAAVRSAVATHIPVFDTSSSRAVQHESHEVQRIARLALARADNGTDADDDDDDDGVMIYRRFVLIGTPDAGKFVDGNGLTMYRLRLSAYDTIDRASVTFDAIVYNSADLGTCVAQLAYANLPYGGPIAASSGPVSKLEGPAAFATPWDYARAFVIPDDPS